MTTQQTRKSINQVLNGVTDPTVLEAYYQILINLMMVHENPAIGFDAEGKPLTAKGLEREVIAASKRVKAGKFTGHEALKQQIREW